MSTAKKRKRGKKPIRFEMSRLALLGWCSGLLLALLWMFMLGLFVGKGITPANINFPEIKKRMIAEGIWPGSGKTLQKEAPSQTKKTKEQIPFEDLEFYDKLAKKKKAQLQKQNKRDTTPQQGTSKPVSPSTEVSPQQKSGSQPQRRLATGQYTVQLASFKDLASAKKFAARFKDLQPSATVRQVDLNGKGRWYRVQVGDLSSRDKARALAKRFTEKYGLQAIVVSLDSKGG